MTTEEAKEFLAWLKVEEGANHFNIWRPSSKPLVITNPEYYDKKREAQIVLGTFQWQRPYEQLVKVHTGLTLERYNGYREKFNLK